MFEIILQEDLVVVHNEIQSLGDSLPALTALHSLNFRYNKLTDAGIPSHIFTGNDLSIVVSACYLMLN